MQISHEIITSRQNKAVSALAALESRKSREKEGLFRFDGGKLFFEAAESGISIRRLFLRERESERWLAAAGKYQNELKETVVTLLSDELFDRVSGEQAPEGIISVAACPEIHARGERAKALLSATASDHTKGILLLESVRDPGNVGTILRSALAFGAKLLVISEDCADLLGSKTVRSAMGALFRLPTARFREIDDAIAILRGSGRRVLGAALDREAMPLGKGVLRTGDCVVIGNEGHGLSREALGACDGSLFIPMEQGSESLNAAMAATVILWSMYTSL